MSLSEVIGRCLGCSSMQGQLPHASSTADLGCLCSIDVREGTHTDIGSTGTIASVVHKGGQDGLEPGMFFAIKAAVTTGGASGLRLVAKRRPKDRVVAFDKIVPLHGQSLEAAQATWTKFEEEAQAAAAASDDGSARPVKRSIMLSGMIGNLKDAIADYKQELNQLKVEA